MRNDWSFAFVSARFTDFHSRLHFVPVDRRHTALAPMFVHHDVSFGNDAP